MFITTSRKIVYFLLTSFDCRRLQSVLRMLEDWEWFGHWPMEILATSNKYIDIFIWVSTSFFKIACLHAFISQILHKMKFPQSSRYLIFFLCFTKSDVLKYLHINHISQQTPSPNCFSLVSLQVISTRKVLLTCFTFPFSTAFLINMSQQVWISFKLHYTSIVII